MTEGNLIFYSCIKIRRSGPLLNSTSVGPGERALMDPDGFNGGNLSNRVDLFGTLFCLVYLGNIWTGEVELWKVNDRQKLAAQRAEVVVHLARY